MVFVSRSQPGAVIHDVAEVADRSLRMVIQGKTTAITGEEIEVQAESICIHGDTPGAVNMAKAVRQALESEGVKLSTLDQLV